MRDSRITVLAATALTNGSASVNGTDIDLLGGYTGDHLNAVNPEYGIGVELMVKSVTLGTDADGFTVAFKWQVAPDNAGVAGTYVDWEPIGVIAYDETNGFTKDGTLAGDALGLSRAKMKARLKGVPSVYAWARVVATATDLEGTGTCTVVGWPSDGSDSLNTQVIY